MGNLGGIAGKHNDLQNQKPQLKEDRFAFQTMFFVFFIIELIFGTYFC